MSQTSETLNPFDPTGMFKGMRDANLDAWSKMMIQLVNSEAYAQATAVMLDYWLAGSGAFRKAIQASMTQALTSVNMPTRDDVTRLAERLTNIEIRLEELEVKVDEVRRSSRQAASGPKGKHGPAEN
ncbi:MAG TPA: hypothetical protein VFE78_39345 [Gemmataceae bacterium]|nr:hypothetical protein [Gemmataceae bacterium]